LLSFRSHPDWPARPVARFEFTSDPDADPEGVSRQIDALARQIRLADPRQDPSAGEIA
jgi:hypothetical protein